MFKAKRKLLALATSSLCLLTLALGQAQNNTTIGRVEPLKLTSLTGYATPTNKREIPSLTQDLTGSATAKSYEPPPEFYRGPGSTSSDSTAASFLSKSTSVLGSGGHLGSVGESLSEAYNKWRNGGKFNYNLPGSALQDRISVEHLLNFSSIGHYGSTGHNTGSHGSVGYAYESHPLEYGHGGSGAGGGASIGGHHYGGPSYYGSSTSAETGVPFDVYSGRPGLGGGHGHYPGAGGEYSYSYPIEGSAHEIATHKGPHDLSQKALLAKSFLIPLASAAVLGIAAALVSNPLLLQLGTVSGVGPTIVGKRKRRETNKNKLQRAYAGHK
ncbi:WW domain-containing protein C660.06 [Scaptodrosophila lebanonensis]|uniref:WW domain-containing protein C660.06 n=1 Tax=Drosophila lebanonensis TaxID=7225 RepID=A0A6J2TQ27_DROLE|nr:WW domain-containing protein C660.06 [Scaptodrosophila lebanonensis]